MLLSRILLSLISLFYGRPLPRPLDDLYTIDGGEHFSEESHFRPIRINKKQSFWVVFNETALYTTLDPSNQGDINKLWGFSEFLFSPHRSSARMGWNCVGGRLFLRPYSYAEGIRVMDPPGVEIPIGKEIHCSISLSPGQYIFEIDEQVFTQKRQGNASCIRAVQLFPYFGGQERAPHGILIQLRPLS